MSDYAQAKREVRKLSIQFKIQTLRQAARTFLDFLRFGSSPTERLIAAVVVSAAFLLLFLGIATVTRQPPNLVLALGGTALVTSLLTIAFFVFGPSDEELKDSRAKVADTLAHKRQELLQLKEQIAVAKKSAEVAQINAPKKGSTETEVSPPARVVRDVQVLSKPLPVKPRMRACPYCREPISATAVKCPHCHEYLDAELAKYHHGPKSNPGIAAVLSFFIPGLGQLYKRQVLGGIIWFLMIYVGLVISFALIPVCGIGLLGLPVLIILYLICIFDAASST